MRAFRLSAAVLQLVILYVAVRVAWSVHGRDRHERDAARAEEEVNRHMATLVREGRANALLVRRLALAVMLLALVNVSIVAYVALR
jgi:hypothetical protein